MDNGFTSESHAPMKKRACTAKSPEFVPRTPLGKELWELRKKIVASGEPLLDWNGIAREVRKRRGGRKWAEGD